MVKRALVILTVGLLVSLVPLGANGAAGTTPERYVVDLRDASPDILDRLTTVPGVRLLHVEPHIGFALVEGGTAALLQHVLGVPVEPDVEGHGAFVPNDPLWGSQWNMPQIGMPAAWDLETGNTRVVVAIIDSGIDATHPDLQGVAINYGTDYVGLDLDPNDQHGHGTHIAGVIAGARHNGVGIAGMADVQLLVIRVLNAANSGSCTNFAAAIVEAALRGADIINLSLHCAASSWPLRAASLFADQSGATLVAAAGNFQQSNPSACVTIPARYEEVLAVAATRSDHAIASFSCQGPEVDIAAPGQGVLSTVPGGGYEAWSGTSMATPHVVAAAALLLSREPTLTNAEIRDVLRATAQDLGPPGLDPAYGHGLLRVDAALAAV